METRQKGNSGGTRITAGNYQELGSSFIRENGGKLIALADGVCQGTKYSATIGQWGAWYAYFKERGIKTAFMTQQGKARKCWTVPAEWPHEFDSEATVQGDYRAGEHFRKNHRPERLDLAEAARRLMTVQTYHERKRQPVPDKHIHPNTLKPLAMTDFKSSSDLRTPPEPASSELHELLKNQGYDVKGSTP